MDKKNIYFSLLKTKGVGNLIVNRIVDSLGNIEKIFEKPKTDLVNIEGISMKLAERIMDNLSDKELQKENAIICENLEEKNINTYLYGEEDYPVNLVNIYDPSPVIFSRGSMKAADANSIAIIGTRRASGYGLQTSTRFAEYLSSRGITVVSGGALGIDSAAHTGAISGGGRTIAVLGSGVLNIYPKQNHELFEKIADNGALLSEYFPDEPPSKHNFPMRNRIISGLSLGIVVIEAPERSGAMITAFQAVDQGKEVMAVPGNIYFEGSRGTNKLIKLGASPVTSPDEIIEYVEALLDKKILGKEKEKTVKVVAGSEKIVELLKKHPATPDYIAGELNLRSNEVLEILTQLELMGTVKMLPGKRFIINE